MTTKVPTYWVSWTKGGGKFSQDFPSAYDDTDADDRARARAQARVDELLAEGATGVRLEKHTPDLHSGRDATETVYPAPEG